MILAVDFDGTLCTNAYPEIGLPNYDVINFVKNFKSSSADNKIILWTCRCNLHLSNAINWCKNFGIVFDSINKNVPEISKLYESEGPKIYADIYLDDKALNIKDIDL